MKKLALALILCATLAACDSPEEKAQAHYESGLALLEEGDLVRARLEFRNALQEVNTHLEARLELARLNVREGITRQAYTEYLRVVEQDPENLEGLIVVSEMAVNRQDWDVFERYSSRALALAPDDPTVQVIEKATRYRNAVIAEDPQARRVVLGEVETLYAEKPESTILRDILLDGYLRDQDFARALVQIEAIIEREPDNLEHHTLKLQILSSMQDVEGVEAELGRMVERFPNDVNIQSNYLRFLVAQGKTDEAEAFLRELAAQAETASDREAQQTALVQFVLQTRGVEAALEELTRALETNPDSITLVTAKASLDFDIGRTEQAMQDLQNIIENAAESATVEQLMNAKVTLARMLQRDGNEVGARRQVEEILETDASNVAALKMQAAWMIGDDAISDAITALRTALGESPQDTDAMLLMAAAYERNGNTALQLDFLSLAAEASNNAPNTALRYAEALAQDDRLTQAEGALIAALRIQPRNTDILSALGQLYVAMDDMSRLRDVISTLENIDTETSRPQAANFRLQLLQAEAGLDEAIGYLEELAESEDSDAARLALIRGHLVNGDTDAALALVEKLLAEDPENPAYLHSKSLTLAAAQDFDGAISEMTALLDKNPDATQVWLQLARLQDLSGDNAAAVQTIDDALEANPDSGNILWAKASALEREGNTEEAIAIYERLYADNSNSVVIANNLASMLTTYRRDEDSLARAEVVSRRLRGTEIPAMQDTYGWILHRTGQSEEALSYLESAAAALTEDPAVQYHLAVVYHALGRTEEAKDQIRIAVEKLNPLLETDLAAEVRATRTAWLAESEN